MRGSPLDPSTLLRMSGPSQGWIPALGGRNDVGKRGGGVPARRWVRLQEGWVPASAGMTAGGMGWQCGAPLSTLRLCSR